MIARILLYLLLATTLVAQAADPPRDVSGVRMTGGASGKRVALILANARYQSIRKLDNPENDAALMEKTLKGLGFRVIGGRASGMNLSAADMSEQLERFASEAQGAEVSVVYYAGHGMVRPGENEQYLVGVEYGGQLGKLPKQAVGLSEVMERLSLLDSRNNLVFLDACRSIGRGQGGMRGSLAFKADPRNTLVLYATAAGDVAADGEGRNSPFTEVLAQELPRKGAEWHDIQLAVINQVQKKTQGQQEPRVYGGLKERIYLTGQVEIEPGAGEFELKYWASIEDSTDAADFEAYLKKYPQGNFRELAENRLKRLRAQAVVQVPQPVVTRPPLPAVENIDGWSGERVRELQSRTAVAMGRAVETPANGNEPATVLIPGGCYTMGSPAKEADRDSDEGPQHRVCVKAFEMGKYEVTQGEWQAVMRENYSRFPRCGSNCPVEWVRWGEIQVYLEKLNASGRGGWRLPSEAEWEYAARAGTTGAFSFSGPITAEKANYDAHYGYEGSPRGEKRRKTVAVGSLPANPWGLHEVHGNVREWVQDCWHDSYMSNPPTDGSAWETGCTNDRQVLRGGSWWHLPSGLRSAVRVEGLAQGDRDNGTGFRLARTLP